ncbi:MAG: sodium:solute symporter [Planctomycetales bacterium]|nr:sodium:solute symporter [Planctomycetales bacterium]
MLLADAATKIPSPGFAVLFALILFIVASVWLGTMAQKAIDKKDFMQGYFLGNRGLGAWALALTATVQSGGTFMGFPSLVFSFGWIVLLWIGAYMMVPLTGFAIVGKRLSHLSRQTNALTVPDLMRSRFDDWRVGLATSLLIILCLSFTMFAQFKAGATIMKHAWPGEGLLAFSEDVMTTVDAKYYVGLIVFAVTVVGYTLIGGFLASVWTDLFQSVMMFFGVLLLVCLAVPMAGGLEQATRYAMEHKSPDIAFGPGYSPAGRDFLPPSLAVSMFCMWVFSGFSSPASMVRVMAAQNTEVMRKSIFLLACYNCCIYIPLVMVCIAAHTLLPDLTLTQSDEVIPRMSLFVTQGLPCGQFISGLILAAPFGAIMASVSCFVLVIASGLVEDIYLKLWNPKATELQVRRATTISMVGVGLFGVLVALNPPQYLQALVVLSSSLGAATLMMPVIMACYWRRATAPGVLASMAAGFVVHIGLYLAGIAQNWATAAAAKSSLQEAILKFLGPDPLIGPIGLLRPYYVLGVDPVLWAMLASVLAGVLVSLVTSPPPRDLISRLFDAKPVAPTSGV